MARERIRPLRREKFEFARSTRQKMMNPRPMITPEAPVCTYAATVGCSRSAYGFSSVSLRGAIGGLARAGMTAARGVGAGGPVPPGTS
jgi:hypothetical protein